MAIATAAVLAGCVHALPPTLVPTETVPVTTSDGWVEPMRRYEAPGPPVLLVHGLGMNHYNWDYRAEISLADALQDAGYDVWIPALRGDPGTEPPTRAARRRITFDQYATLDLPAAIALVAGRTGGGEIGWVGHSMGGMLLYATLALDPEPIGAGVTVCSPASFAAAYPRRYLRFVPNEGRLPAKAAGRLVVLLGKSNPTVGEMANRANLDWPTTAGLLRRGMVDVPVPLAKQVAGWTDSGALTLMDGRAWVRPAEVPLLVLGGSVDRVVPAADVEVACDVFPDCRYVELSAASGFSADYGHIDPIFGERAREEVYPLVIHFLDAHLRSSSQPSTRDRRPTK